MRGVVQGLLEMEPAKELLMPLLPYQKQFLGWAISCEQGQVRGGILADEMVGPAHITHDLQAWPCSGCPSMQTCRYQGKLCPDTFLPCRGRTDDMGPCLCELY